MADLPGGAAAGRVVDLGDRVQAEPLGERDRLAEVVDRAARARRPRSAARTTRRRCAVRSRASSSAASSVAVRDPGGVGGEARVVRQVGAAERLGQRPKSPSFAAATASGRSAVANTS